MENGLEMNRDKLFELLDNEILVDPHLFPDYNFDYELLEHFWKQESINDGWAFGHWGGDINGTFWKDINCTKINLLQAMCKYCCYTKIEKFLRNNKVSPNSLCLENAIQNKHVRTDGDRKKLLEVLLKKNPKLKITFDHLEMSVKRHKKSLPNLDLVKKIKKRGEN